MFVVAVVVAEERLLCQGNLSPIVFLVFCLFVASANSGLMHARQVFILQVPTLRSLRVRCVWKIAITGIMWTRE